MIREGGMQYVNIFTGFTYINGVILDWIQGHRSDSYGVHLAVYQTADCTGTGEHGSCAVCDDFVHSGRSVVLENGGESGDVGRKHEFAIWTFNTLRGVSN